MAANQTLVRVKQEFIIEGAKYEDIDLSLASINGEKYPHGTFQIDKDKVGDLKIAKIICRFEEICVLKIEAEFDSKEIQPRQIANKIKREKNISLQISQEEDDLKFLCPEKDAHSLIGERFQLPPKRKNKFFQFTCESFKKEPESSPEMELDFDRY